MLKYLFVKKTLFQHAHAGALSQFQELERTVYNSLYTLVRDTSVLRDYTHSVLVIVQVMQLTCVNQHKWDVHGDLLTVYNPRLTLIMSPVLQSTLRQNTKFGYITYLSRGLPEPCFHV